MRSFAGDSDRGRMTPTKSKPIYSPSMDRTKRISENSNPNLSPSVYSSKKSPSPASKTKTKVRSSFSDAIFAAATKRMSERKFLVAKKNKKPTPERTVPCKCGEMKKGNSKKCLCTAYESLRASQEEFFRNRKPQPEDEDQTEQAPTATEATNNGVQINGEAEKEKITGNLSENPDGFNSIQVTTSPRKLRDQVLEEALISMPEQGSGRVMHLVKAFESLLSFRMHTGDDEGSDGNGCKVSEVLKWALPGLHSEETSSSCKPFSLSSSSEFMNTTWKSGTDSMIFASIRSSNGEGSLGGRVSTGSRRSRRSSTDSSGRTGKRTSNNQLRVTCQKPFKLRTEQRGKHKEEEFFKRMQEMLLQEERLRFPIAQGLPWTTDEPECLVKPSVKESTRPLDIRLCSDMRAVERAEFDQAVAEKMSLIEQYKLERERQQKLAEEEELKQLRRELVPRAQPMPYFDRPFIPQRSSKLPTIPREPKFGCRSSKLPTIPREPKFHIPQHKKMKDMSWNDICFCQNT